jgi:hypothetical protein
VAGASNAFLDQRPELVSWTLLGCARSRDIHQWFYGEVPRNVDICPRMRTRTSGPVLTKCCLLEDTIAPEPGRVVVPWGASLNQVREALGVLAQQWEPQWRPV